MFCLKVQLSGKSPNRSNQLSHLGNFFVVILGQHEFSGKLLNVEKHQHRQIHWWDI